MKFNFNVYNYWASLRLLNLGMELGYIQGDWVGLNDPTRIHDRITIRIMCITHIFNINFEFREREGVA